METPFVNIHTHTYVPDGSIQVVSLDIGEIGELDRFRETQYLTAGIHPYNAAKYSGANIEELFHPILQRLSGIGEIGLDRSIDTSIELQTEVFVKQLGIASKEHLPAIVHCVKAYSDLLGVLKSFRDITYIFHGFYGNMQVEEQLLQYKSFFSLGIRELSRPNASDKLRQIPLDRLLLETDNKECSIEETYKSTCEFFEIGMTELKEQIFNNFKLAINARMD